MKTTSKLDFAFKVIKNTFRVFITILKDIPSILKFLIILYRAIAFDIDIIEPMPALEIMDLLREFEETSPEPSLKKKS